MRFDVVHPNQGGDRRLVDWTLVVGDDVGVSSMAFSTPRELLGSVQRALVSLKLPGGQNPKIR